MPASGVIFASKSSLWEEPRLFLSALLALIFMLVTWAALAPIDRVVRVEGKVIPAGRSEQIQHLEGGIVASINTVEGASVKKGDLLLTIDDTTAGTNLSEAQIKLDSQRTRAVRLEAETTGKMTLKFPDDLANTPMAEAELSLFMARRAKLSEEIAVHQDAIKQHQADINDALQRQQRLSMESTTAQKRLAMEQGMAADGAASKMDVLEAQSREQRLNTEIAETSGVIPKLKASIAQEQARISSAQADFQEQAHNDMVATLEEIDRLKQSITAANDRMKRTEVRSPADGIINRINVNTVGSVVKPGEEIMQLIPKTNALLIEAKAQPRDRGYLQPDLPAEVRVSAFDAGELGLLKGKVTQVGADSLQDTHNDSFYQVDILVDTLPSSYAGHPIVPGMTVTADIVTGRRTVLAYLLSPLRKFTYSIFRDPR